MNFIKADIWVSLGGQSKTKGMGRLKLPRDTEVEQWNGMRSLPDILDLTGKRESEYYILRFLGVGGNWEIRRAVWKGCCTALTVAEFNNFWSNNESLAEVRQLV